MTADGPVPLHPRGPYDAIFDPTNTDLLAEHERVIGELWERVTELESIVRRLSALAGDVNVVSLRP